MEQYKKGDIVLLRNGDEVTIIKVDTDYEIRYYYDHPQEAAGRSCDSSGSWSYGLKPHEYDIVCLKYPVPQKKEYVDLRTMREFIYTRQDVFGYGRIHLNNLEDVRVYREYYSDSVNRLTPIAFVPTGQHRFYIGEGLEEL